MSEVNGKLLQVSTKNGKGRNLPIPENLIKEILELVISTPRGKEVFVSKRGTRLRKANFARNVFKPALAKTNLKGVRFHDLRHTAVSLQINAGADVLAVSRVAGHSKPSTTLNVYAHELDNSSEAIRNVMDELLTETAFDKYSTERDSRSA